MAASPKISSPFFGLTYQPLECYLMLVLFIAGPMSCQGSYSSHLYHGALKLSTCYHSKGFSVQDSLCRIVSSLTITPITRHYIILVVGAFLQVCRGTQVHFFNAFLAFKNVFNSSFVFYAIIMYFEYKINPNNSNKRRLFCCTVSINFYCFVYNASFTVWHA